MKININLNSFARLFSGIMMCGALLLILPSFVLAGQQEDSDGNGLIEVRSAVDLDNIRHNLRGTCADGNCYGYELINDIDLSSYPNWEPIGTLYRPFRATFEGNEHKISGLTSTGYERAGLFGVVYSAHFRKVRIEAKEISAFSSKRDAHAGVLLGSGQFVSIEDVQVSATAGVSASVNIINLGAYAGALAGYLQGDPNLCFTRDCPDNFPEQLSVSSLSGSSAMVSGEVAATSRNKAAAGGLVGYAKNFVIRDNFVWMGWLGQNGDQPIESGISASINSFIFNNNNPAFFSVAGGLVGAAQRIQIVDNNAILERTVGVIVFPNSLTLDQDPFYISGGGLVGAQIDRSGGNLPSVIRHSYYAPGLITDKHWKNSDKTKRINNLGEQRTGSQLSCPVGPGDNCKDATTYVNWNSDEPIYSPNTWVFRRIENPYLAFPRQERFKCDAFFDAICQLYFGLPPQK